MPQVAIVVGGVLHIGLAILHLFFARIFAWRTDLAKLTFVNAQIMQVMNFCLAYIFFVVGCVSILEPKGTYGVMEFNFFVALFWFLRAVLQVRYFTLKHRASVVLFSMFLVMSALYGYAWADARIPDSVWPGV